MVLTNKKVIWCLAQEAAFLQAFRGKMFYVVRDYRTCLSIYSRRQNVPVAFVRTFETIQQLRRELYKGLGKAARIAFNRLSR